jgi:uncharacterized protein
LYIALCRICLDLQESQSLKEKRNTLRSIKQRLRHEFNISIAEVDQLHTLTKGVVAAVSVSNDPKYLEGQMQALLNAVERYYPGKIESHEVFIEFADPEQE